MQAFARTSWAATFLTRVGQNSSCRRHIHGTAARLAITHLQMPAMSPTMTEGGIAQWKKKEGEAFSAGDVLLEIETDKATIDVEAQDDGILGKILTPDGTKNVSVGKVIGLLAEEGDDISNLEAPKEEPPRKESAPSPETQRAPEPQPQPQVQASAEPPSGHSGPQPKHSRPLFPSVHRLLLENNIADAEKIQGTGIRGMLTKGDVLAYLGKASSPRGTNKQAESQPSKPAPKEEQKPLDGPAIRRMIVSNLLNSSLRARNAIPTAPNPPDFDSIISDYLPNDASAKTIVTPPPSHPRRAQLLIILMD